MSKLTRLSADEFAYHQSVVGQMKAARAAWESWSGHLAQKYALAPGDNVAESGAIERAAKASG